MALEQAIFTSLRSHQQEGYQLAATSPGIDVDLAKELAAWGPAHDSLLISTQGTTSINFHPLSAGYCISKTTAAGEEYSGRGGPRVYTQMIVVPAADLLRFANNPFAIIEALEASNKFCIHDRPPEVLEPLALLGRASLVNSLRVAELWGDPGTNAIVALAQAAIHTNCLAVRARTPLARLFAGLIQLLPLQARPLFSFSTGLRYSPRRPFRLIALPPDTPEQRSLQRASHAELLDLTRTTRQAIADLDQGWAYLLQDVFESKQLRVLPELLRRAAKYDCTKLSLDEIAMRIEADVQAGV